LPGPHRDPFDRMLIAQAMLDHLALVSNDPPFDAYGVARLW
jgi:PIN domain nuclease of toxin-antitoxin system